MVYLKKFDTHSEYENYINGGSGLFVPEILWVSSGDHGETMNNYNVPVYERGTVIAEITYKVYKPSFSGGGGVGVYWCSGYFSEDYHRNYLSGGMVSLDDFCAWNNGTYEDMGDYYIITLHNLTRNDDEWNSDDYNLWSLVWVYSTDIYANEVSDYTILKQYINWEASTEEPILPNVSICADALGDVYYNAIKLPDVFRILSARPYNEKRSLIVTNAGLGAQDNRLIDAIQSGDFDYIVGDNTVTVMEGNEQATFNIVDRTDDFVLCCVGDIYDRYIFGIKEKTMFEFGGFSFVPGNSDVTDCFDPRDLGARTVEEWISSHFNNDRPVTECKLIGKSRNDIVNEYDDLVLKYTSAGIDEAEAREALDNEIRIGADTDNWSIYGIRTNAYAIDTLGNIWPLKTSIGG